ncbi:hypothetical protein JCM3766R1_003692 [Sporobolomyces carnicolor]
MPLEDLVAKGWHFVDDSRPKRPPRFSDAEIAKLRERRRLAKASPFRKGSQVTFELPSLYPKAIYSPHDRPSNSPNPLRLANTSLLEFLKGSETKEAEVRLREGVRRGVNFRSQVWSGDIKVEGKRHKIIVKLYAEALYLLPVRRYQGRWMCQEERAKREAEAYKTLSSRQGDDIPICYGIYKFSAPWGETVIGVILEDLREVGAPIRDWARNYLRYGDGFREAADDNDSDFEAMSTSSEEESDERDLSQEEVAEHELVLRKFASPSFSGLPPSFHAASCEPFVLRSGSLEMPHFVFPGFSHHSSRVVAEGEEYASLYEDSLKYEGREWADKIKRDFRATGERELTGTLRLYFGEDLWYAWAEHNLFPFV